MKNYLVKDTLYWHLHKYIYTLYRINLTVRDLEFTIDKHCTLAENLLSYFYGIFTSLTSLISYKWIILQCIIMQSWLDGEILLWQQTCMKMSLDKLNNRLVHRTYNQGQVYRTPLYIYLILNQTALRPYYNTHGNISCLFFSSVSYWYTSIIMHLPVPARSKHRLFYPNLKRS